MTGEKDSSFNFFSSVSTFSLWFICSLSFSCQAVGSTSQYHPSYFTSSAKFFKTHLWTSFRFHSFSFFFRPEKAQVASLRRRSFTSKEIMRCLARNTREFERNGKDIMCFLITCTSQGHLYLLRIDAVGLESKMLKKKHRCENEMILWQPRYQDLSLGFWAAWLFSTKVKGEILETRLITLHTQAHSLHLFV